jgi:hypothetical protein
VRESSPMGVGVVTILTVLLVLCLTVFSALTLSTARSDLALSHRNADTVRAYYEADAQAARLYADFTGGDVPELETAIPMTETQSLYLHLIRQADGSVLTLAWRTQAEEETELDDHLPVWDGTPPAG